MGLSTFPVTEIRSSLSFLLLYVTMTKEEKLIFPTVQGVQYCVLGQNILKGGEVFTYLPAPDRWELERPDWMGQNADFKDVQLLTCSLLLGPAS